MVLTLGAFASGTEISVQGTTTLPNKTKSIEIKPEPIGIKAGDPLSKRALVHRPYAIPAVRSWTIETKLHRWLQTVIAASPDGSLVLSGGYDGIVRIRNGNRGKFFHALVAADYCVDGISWSPDGNYLASSGSYDGTACIWNPRAGQLLRVLKGQKSYTSLLAWSLDGKILAACGGISGYATFWDFVANKQLETVEHCVAVSAISWSSDSTKLTCAASTNNVSIWTRKNECQLRQ